MTRLERLMMRVEMIDKASGPANKLAANLDRITERAKVGFSSIVQGSVGLVGVGYAMNTLTGDARDMSKAIGEVASLDVAGDVLARLEKRATTFSVAYGESATDFVRSSYDIQSAIAGLVGDELSTFTEASNILAKGTKSDAATITNYMGTMYGIFKNSADAMGKSAWVEQLTGQTASAVQMFKTTGGEMSAAFSSLGAAAQTNGVQLSEQMAILGTLQATMSGSEAGTKYKSFLTGVGRAQEALGLQFEDSHGKMLPMSEILTALQGKFGKIDTVAKSDMLKKAFGSDEAVAAVKLLMNDTDGLTSSIQKLGQVRGMEKAEQMARSMVDPLDRLNAANTALRRSFGKLLLESLNPFYDKIADGMGTIIDWMEMFPAAAGLVAKLTLGVFAFTGALSALLIVKGLYILTATGLSTALTILRFVMIPFGPLLGALRMSWVVLNMQLATGAGLIPALRAAWVALRTQMVINTAAAWALNVAFWANPITWIVGGVIALVAGLVLLYKNWDQVTAGLGRFREMIEDNPILNFLLSPLLAVVDAVGLLITGLGKLPQFFKWISTINPFALIGKGVEWLIEKIRSIPGAEMFLDASSETAKGISKESPSDFKVSARHVPPGGLMEQINNNSNRTTHIEKLEVNTSRAVNGYSLADELAMAAG